MTDDTKKIPTEDVVLHADCQHREQLSQEAVEAYAERYGDDGMDALPPIRVFMVSGQPVCIDGFHRIAGAQQAGLSFVRVEVAGEGEIAEAAWEALKSNHDHGVRRTPEDKRKAVLQALENPIGQEQSSRVIAEQCGVSHPLVSKLRKQWEAEQGVDSPTTREGADGKSYPAGGNVTTSDDAEDYPAGDAEAPGSHPGEADADSPTTAQTADTEGQRSARVDAGGTGDGEAEPPPPSDGADDEDDDDDDHPSWLPRYGSELQAYADDLRRVNRNRSAQTNASGPWGQAAAEVHRTVKQAITKAEAAIPVVCPACGGREGKGCSVCRRSGWLTAGEAEQVSTSKRKRRKAS